MAGNSNEPGGPPQPKGRNAGGPADRNRLIKEYREDPRIPFEEGRDDVRRDREGHRPAAARGQHRDAGTAAAKVGRQEGHQEGRQRPSRPFVSAERAVCRHPLAYRPRRASEDRPDRGESQEAQDIRVGSRVRTPIWDATRTAWAIFRNSPWPTTPGMLEIRLASFTGPRIGPKCASRMWFPLSVRKGSSPSFRNSTFAPSASSAAPAFFQPNGWTSTGNGVLVPRRRTSFASSTITTNFFDAAATIFSRNRAPPIPLIRSSLGSTSSAPSTVRSSQKLSSSEVNGIPRRFASSAVSSDVGTPFKSIPSATRRATPARKCRAVDPVPRPRTMPGFTYASAASAAFLFSSSREAIQALRRSSSTSFTNSPITRLSSFSPSAFDAFDGSPVTPDQYFRGSDTIAYGGISFFPAGLLPFTRSGRAVMIRDVSPAPAWPSPSGRMPCEA